MKTATNSDGKDITESIQLLYDCTVSSMDWGSGYLGDEEMLQIIQIAIDMSWEVPEVPSSIPGLEVVKRFPDHYAFLQRLPNRIDAFTVKQLRDKYGRGELSFIEGTTGEYAMLLSTDHWNILKMSIGDAKRLGVI